MARLFLVLVLGMAAADAGAQPWFRARPSQAPAPRYDHCMCFDSARGRTVLFGGYEFLSGRTYQDTWEFDGRDWQQRQAANSPSARQDAGMCFDAKRGVVVLFGGRRGGDRLGKPTYFDDTWEYDGKDWRKISVPGTPPSARCAPLAYDSRRGVVVLFGGYGGNAPSLYTDLWEYDGVRWTQRQVSHGPTARSFWGVAFDERRGKLVAHSGFVMGQPSQMETWEWDGSVWTKSSAAPPLTPMTGPEMCYDAARGVCVLSGALFTLRQETWEYDASGWRQANATTGQIDLNGHQIAYDSWRNQVVQFGGEVAVGFQLVATDATWLYGGAARFDRVGTSCSSAPSQPNLAPKGASLPQLGGTLDLQVVSVGTGNVPLLFVGFSDTRWAGLPLPLALTPFGLPGCDLRVGPELVLPAMPVRGTANWSLPMPQDAAWQGFTFFAQALLLDASLRPVGLSNAGRAQVGR